MPKLNKLTPKMEHFSRLVASGTMAVDAYKQAYNADNMQDNTIRREAYKLMQRDDITERVKELQIPLQNYGIQAHISEREHKKQILYGIVHDTGEKTENKLRALDILNRMDQEYMQQLDIDDTETTIDNLDTDKLIKLVSSA